MSSVFLFNKVPVLSFKIKSFSYRQRLHLPVPDLYLQVFFRISHLMLVSILSSLHWAMNWDSLVLFLFFGFFISDLCK